MEKPKLSKYVQRYLIDKKMRHIVLLGFAILVVAVAVRLIIGKPLEAGDLIFFGMVGGFYALIAGWQLSLVLGHYTRAKAEWSKESKAVELESKPNE